MISPSTGAMCSFDKIYILSSVTCVNLKKVLPVEKLRHECSLFRIDRLKGYGVYMDFCSSVTVVAPTKTFFDILDDKLLGHYKISQLEIAKDVFFETEIEALLEQKKLCAVLVKKYTSLYHRFDKTGSSSKVSNGLFGDVTEYHQNKKLALVIYCRVSKQIKEPCLHIEWKITSAFEVSKRTGIKTLTDLSSFDHSKFMSNTAERYLQLKEIDTERLGQTLLGIGNRKNYSAKMQRKVQLCCAHFLNIYGIDTPAALKQFFTDIKKTLKYKKGPKTTWERILLKTNPDRLCRPITMSYLYQYIS